MARRAPLYKDTAQLSGLSNVAVVEQCEEKKHLDKIYK